MSRSDHDITTNSDNDSDSSTNSSGENSSQDFFSLLGNSKEMVRHQHDRADLQDNRTRKDPNQDYRRQAAQQQFQQLVDGLSDEIAQLVDPEQELIHAGNGVQLNLMKKLRKGHIPWQQGLDLHGHSVDLARDELSRFIRDSARDGSRCVLVVHGKASNNEGAPAMIKSHVNDWLRQMPQVLAFVSALAKDGGVGALYVLLKKARP